MPEQSRHLANKYENTINLQGWAYYGGFPRSLFLRFLFYEFATDLQLAPTWTAFSDYTGPDLLCSTVFHF